MFPSNYAVFIMNPPADTQNAAPAVPLPDFESLLTAISHSTRWKILKELSAGEPLLIAELVARIGGTADLMSKHLAVLRNAGLVTLRGRLHQIVKAHLPVPGQPVVDFGHCLLRLDKAG